MIKIHIYRRVTKLIIGTIFFSFFNLMFILMLRVACIFFFVFFLIAQAYGKLRGRVKE